MRNYHWHKNLEKGELLRSVLKFKKDDLTFKSCSALVDELKEENKANLGESQDESDTAALAAAITKYDKTNWKNCNSPSLIVFGLFLTTFRSCLLPCRGSARRKLG